MNLIMNGLTKESFVELEDNGFHVEVDFIEKATNVYRDNAGNRLAGVEPWWTVELEIVTTYKAEVGGVELESTVTEEEERRECTMEYKNAMFAIEVENGINDSDDGLYTAMFDCYGDHSEETYDKDKLQEFILENLNY